MGQLRWLAQQPAQLAWICLDGRYTAARHTIYALPRQPTSSFKLSDYHLSWKLAIVPQGSCWLLPAAGSLLQQAW